MRITEFWPQLALLILLAGRPLAANRRICTITATHLPLQIELFHRNSLIIDNFAAADPYGARVQGFLFAVRRKSTALQTFQRAKLFN